MARYLLIESKGPLNGGNYAFDLGQQLRELNHDVTIYLVQDGVFAARRGFTAGQRLVGAADKQQLRVLADRVSLRQRGLGDARLAKEVRPSDMEALVDTLMEQSDKVIWH